LTRFLVWSKKARGKKKQRQNRLLWMCPVTIYWYSDHLSGRSSRLRQSALLSILSKDVKERRPWHFQHTGAGPARLTKPSERGKTRGMKPVVVTGIPQKDIENEKKTLEFVSDRIN